jgi:hypothetical protein
VTSIAKGSLYANSGELSISNSSLEAAAELFANLQFVFLYLTIVAILWDRENAINVASGWNAGKRWPVMIAIHGTLAVLLLAFGTTAVALYAALYVKASEHITGKQIDHYLLMEYYMSYVVQAVLTLTAFAAGVATILLHKAARKAGIRDQVQTILLIFARDTDMWVAIQITRHMIWVVVPCFMLLHLMILLFFAILQLPTILKINGEVASIANIVLVQGFTFLVIVAILFLSVGHGNWVVEGGIEPMGKFVHLPAQRTVLIECNSVGHDRLHILVVIYWESHHANQSWTQACGVTALRGLAWLLTCCDGRS